jgi:hypothetical protein
VKPKLQKCRATIEVAILGHNEPLTNVLDLIEERERSLKIRPTQTVVQIDMDGTLSDLRYYTKQTSAVRGGEDTLEFLDELNDRNTKWFIVSARNSSNRGVYDVALLAEELELPVPKFAERGLDECLELKQGFSTPYKQGTQPYAGFECGHIAGARAAEKSQSREKNGKRPPPALPKQHSVDFLAKLYYQQYPRQIVFIDDDASNASDMIEAFLYKEPFCSHRTHFLFVLWQPELGEEPSKHENALHELAKLLEAESPYSKLAAVSLDRISHLL